MRLIVPTWLFVCFVVVFDADGSSVVSLSKPLDSRLAYRNLIVPTWLFVVVAHGRSVVTFNCPNF